jgi:hypothetical protein
METIFGDGSNQQSGLFDKLLSAGKRVLTGASLFMTAYSNQNYGKSKVSFAAPYPGKIIPLDCVSMMASLSVRRVRSYVRLRAYRLAWSFLRNWGQDFLAVRASSCKK